MVRAVQCGQSCRAVANGFGVSVASVVKWSQRHRATGSAAAKPMGSRRPYIRGIVVSHVAVWNILRRERQTFKKNRLRQRAGSP